MDNFPPVTQRNEVRLLGFKGLKLYCLKEGQLNQIDISLNSALQKYL